jgi:isoaspartyl dipeptidase IadA
VWQFWQRLQDAGVAFWPGRNESRGVFPMIFLPGLSGQFIAIADTEAAAQDLRPLAENCLKVPVRVRQPAISQKYSVFKRADIVNKANYRRIWCLSPLNSKFISSFNVNQLTPLHAVTLLRPGLDVIVLPNRPDVREFFRFVKATTGLDDSQVVWTSGRTNCLHTDIDGEAVDRLKALITAQQDSPAVVAAASDNQHQGADSHSSRVTSTYQQSSSRTDGLASSATTAADTALQQQIASRTSSWLSPSVHIGAGRYTASPSSNTHGKSVLSAPATAGHAPGPIRRASFGASSNSSSVGSGTGSGSSSCGWIIIPDTPSSSFQKWAGPLIDHGVRVFADLPLWMSQYGHKGILHKHISQVSAAAPATDTAAQSGPPSAAAVSKAAAPGGTGASVIIASEAGIADGSSPQGGSPTASAAAAQGSASSFNPADSAVEDLQELVYVPKGYVCSSTQDLHKAYDLLVEQTASSRVSLKPVRAGASPGEGSLKCASKQELAYYDFPLGDVIMQEDIALDSAPDGLLLLPRLPYLAGDRLGNTVVDMLLVGDQIAGYRPSCLSAEMQQQLAEVSARFLSKVNPKGAGALSFGLSDGKLALLGAQMGTFTPEHFLKMFLERWTEVEDCTYFCWQHVPPKSLDVWQFWARLIETGVAFKPGSSTSGVYPLVFLPGVIGTFIAISSEDGSDTNGSSHLEDLRAAAIAALTAPAAAPGTALLQATGWSADDRRVFVTGASRDQHQQQLRFVLPIRSLCLARKDLDFVVLPGGHEPTSEFASWASKQLGLQHDQLLFTSGHSYALDEDISSDVISELKQLLVTSDGSWTLVPLRPSPSFYSWARPLHELNVKVLAAPEGGRYSSKAVLYRRAAAPDVPSVIEQIDPEIAVAQGFICSKPSDLITAYKLLAKSQQQHHRGHPASHSQRHGLSPSSLRPTSSNPVLLKPLSGSGDGEGLLVVSDEDQLMLYDFAEGQDVVLQELLVLDRAPDGMVLSLAVPFADGHVLSSYAMDEVLVGQAAVGFRPTEATKRFKQKALSIAQVLVQGLSEVIMGTFYFVSVDGEPVLMGYDPTECSGIHLVRLFLHQHAPEGSCFYSWRFKPPVGVGIEKFWDVLRSKGLAYELSSGKSKGVFPLYYLRGLEVMLVAFGASALDCCLLQDKARQSIDRAFRRPLAKAAAGPRGSSPQPAPPLDGGGALQPPALGLGPPATALRGAARTHTTPWDAGNGSAGVFGESAGSSPAGSVSGMSPSSSLVAPAAAGSLLGSALSSSFPYSSARAQIAAQPSPLGQSNMEVDRSRAGDPKQMAMALLLGAEAVYGPSLLEERNILMAGGKIIAILDDESAEVLRSSLPGVSVLDCKGCIITPGFVDCHVHITGGGGEAGPASRCPPSRLSEFLDAGITCVVGLLGTDDVSRSNEELIIKAQALNEEGMTAYTWIGSYHAPPATVTGGIRRDMCLVQSAIGVGELAVADHRGSQLCAAEVAKIAAEARVGGMLSGKAGIVHIHVGPGASGLQVLRDAVAGSDIPLTQFHPTHMDRSEDLINQGAKWLLDGGSLDFTVRSIRARRALQQYHQTNVPLGSVTVSSDAFGSLPSYDSDGRLVSYTVADAKALLRALRNMYFQDHWPLERILPLMTANPARVLKLKQKGRIAVGADADLLVLSHATLQLKWVYAKGVMRKCPQWTQGGFFEKGSKIKPYRASAGKDEDEDM